MAVFTPLSRTDAERIGVAFDLGEVLEFSQVSAGTVNSNFHFRSTHGEYFVRVYEEQGVDGVRYEWRLLDHLGRGGIPVPVRPGQVSPGAVSVVGKPVAVFELVAGEMCCQGSVSVDIMRRIGSLLGRVHTATDSFSVRKASRFGFSGVRLRLDRVERSGDESLRPLVNRLRATNRTLEAEAGAWSTAGADFGVIHGDLFRDNVLWRDGDVAALLDWESAADGFRLFDLAVVLLSWCFGSAFDWNLVRSLCCGYGSERVLHSRWPEQLYWACRVGAVRFAATRLTDVHLRRLSGDARASGQASTKDYRRFVRRLDALEDMGMEGFRSQLSPDTLSAP